MTTLLPVADLDTFVSTRDSLHRVAEHVVAKARYVDDREIRLTAFLGIEPGFPRELYEPATTFDPDQPLDLDRSAAEVLAAWYGFTAEVLDQFASEIPEATPSTRILWPEHFDQAFYTEDADEARRPAPQLKVMIPPSATASITACEVQLAGVPAPIT